MKETKGEGFTMRNRLAVVEHRIITKSGDLLEEDDREWASRWLFKLLFALPEQTVVEVDFSAIRYMCAKSADDILVRALLRIQTGQYPEVYIVATGVKQQHRGNIDMALTVRHKAMIVGHSDTSWAFLGYLIASYRSALDRSIRAGDVTARELQERMGFKTVNEASTKLSYLHQQGLIARERAKGRSYRYLSLV